MASQSVGTLVLQGQESIDFVNSLFRPTQEEIDHFRAALDRIDRNIEVCNTEDGFVAHVANLDLSFLGDLCESDKKIVDKIFKINIKNRELFGASYSSDATVMSELTLDISNDNLYDDSYDDSYDNTYLFLAA